MAPMLLEREGQVHGHGRLPDAALSAGDGDEIFHALNGQFGRLGMGGGGMVNFS